MKIRGAVVGNVKFFKHKLNMAARNGVTMRDVDKMRAFLVGVNYYEHRRKKAA